MAEGFKFTMNMDELIKVQSALKMFPKETQRAVAQYLNDQARLFKDLAPKVLATKYKIRNPTFVNSQFRIEKANPTEKIGGQQASVYTSDHYGRFSGWEEEITGGPRPLRSSGEGHYGRFIWNTARGGDPNAQVKGQFRLRADQDIIPDSRQYGLPIPQFLAMLSKSLDQKKKVKGKRLIEQYYYNTKDGNRRKKKVYTTEYYAQPKRLLGKNKVFILGGHGWPLGLYHFKGMEGTTFPEVEALQQFKQTPPLAEKFDWVQMTSDKVQAWFGPEVIVETYLAPILSQLWTK